jgi:CheY-like chemotaxis protein
MEQKHILVVDDQPEVRQLLRSLLTWDGHRVTEAPDGLAALDLFLRDHFDLVITDYQMPGMLGLEFAGKVKKCLATQPVLMLTGHLGVARPDTQVVDAFLAKPFAVPAFRLAVARLLASPTVPAPNRQGGGPAAP